MRYFPEKSMRRVRLTMALVISIASCAAAGQSQDPPRGVMRVLLDRKLQERSVMLVGVDDKTVSYTDSSGLVRSEAIGEFLAVLSPTAEEKSHLRPASLIELNDGERFVGVLIGDSRSDKADSILWEHAALGIMEFKLDALKRIQFQGGSETSPRAPDASGDLVVLVNGDRMEGFIESVGPSVRIDVNGTKRELPVDRVQEIVLGAAAASGEEKDDIVAWLKDGSVVACRSIHTTRMGELVLSPRVMSTEPERTTEAPAPIVSLRLDDLWALSLSPRSIVPLASLPISRQEAGPGRGWTRPAAPVDLRWAAVGLADIEFPGPMTVEWDLPRGATRFAAEAELPRQMWTWGDCELVVTVVGTSGAGGESELWRKRINAEAAKARIAASLPEGARKLRITLDAGEYGAVQDKIVLHRAAVLVEKK